MEDEEDDLFNNKYLADLKEGRCIPQAGTFRKHCSFFFSVVLVLF